MSEACRAKGNSRRFCRSNGLCFLWTLTYKKAPKSRKQVIRDIRRFFEDLQELYGRLPLIAVIERGRRRTRRLHVHFAADRWLDHGLVEAVWDRGFVWVGDPGKLPGNPGVDALSKYLAKYIGKEYEREQAGESDRGKGEHRYYVTQGWEVPRVRAWFRHAAGALASLIARYAMPDAVVAFGEPHADEIHGYWLHFPDESLWDPPTPGP